MSIMVIETNDVFIGIPKVRNTQPKITVDGTDLTSKVIDSEWIKPLLNIGVGNFYIRLSNAGGQLTDLYKAGDEVICILDNGPKTRIQFKGRIDYPREILQQDGQYLDIVGRHKSFFLSERRVCHSATDTDCSQILKDIMDKYAMELTQTGIQTSGVLTDVEWDYKIFTECIAELMGKSVHDAYVDNDLDMQFFPANSILNEDEAIAENDNFLKTDEVGQDDYYERTRVTVVGEDDVGIPILFTAINGVDDEESEREDDGIREIHVKDSALNTMDKVRKLAQARLAEHTNRPSHGVWHTFGLETLEPGENLWIAVPQRQKVYGIYKAVQIKHKFGAKSGGWRTITQTESHVTGTEELIGAAYTKTDNITKSKNPNKLNYSFNIPFDDEEFTTSHEYTQIKNGVLQLSDPLQNEGTWISTLKTAPVNVSELEMRVKGKDLGASEFYYSLTNGTTYTKIDDFKTLYEALQAGKLIKLKIILKKSYYNTNPEVDSVALLYR